MIRVWGTLKREQKIISGHVVTFPGEARTQALAEILRTLCYELDIPRRWCWENTSESLRLSGGPGSIRRISSSAWDSISSKWKSSKKTGEREPR